MGGDNGEVNFFVSTLEKVNNFFSTGRFQFI